MSEKQVVVIEISPKPISDEDLVKYVGDGIQWDVDERQRDYFGDIEQQDERSASLREVKRLGFILQSL